MKSSLVRVKRLAEGKPPEPFKYIDKGTMAQIGRGAALIELPTGQTMTGRLAWLGVHLALLNGAEEKISTFVDWGWTIFTKEDAKRIIPLTEYFPFRAVRPIRKNDLGVCIAKTSPRWR